MYITPDVLHACYKCMEEKFRIRNIKANGYSRWRGKELKKTMTL
jgi:hypothetical protein